MHKQRLHKVTTKGRQQGQPLQRLRDSKGKKSAHIRDNSMLLLLLLTVMMIMVLCSEF
jgi:hypothetical protein